jgi:hypothetical protein
MDVLGEAVGRAADEALRRAARIQAIARLTRLKTATGGLRVRWWAVYASLL